MPRDLQETIKKFLNYSLVPIDWDYDQLTRTEQGLISREEFEKLKLWALTN